MKETYCPTCGVPALAGQDCSGTVRYHPAGPHEEVTSLREALIELIAAVEGRVGEDTVDESLRYMSAMNRARDLVDKPMKVIEWNASGYRSERPRVHYNLEPLPHPIREGDVYEFLFDMSTRAGHTHWRGSRLYVHDRTTRTPHDEIGESGHNWICRTEYGISVWATLEQCLSRRVIRRVETQTQTPYRD